MGSAIRKQNHPCIDLQRLFSAAELSDEDRLVWPENRLQTIGLRDDLLKSFAEIRKTTLRHDPHGQTLIDVLRFHWIRLVLSLAYNQKLADALTFKGLSIDCDNRYPVLSALMSREKLPDDRFLPALAVGPPRYQKWRWPIRMLRRTFEKSAVRAFPWPSPGRNGEIVTVTQGSRVDQLARTRRVRPRHCEFDQWFGPVELSQKDWHNDLVGSVCETINEALSAFGLELRPELYGWLERQFEQSVAGVEAHLAKLRTLETIPQELWIGSSSSFWPRLLAKEVMRRGGRIVAFDHGFGSGYFKGVDVPFSIQPFCTEFVVEDELQADQIQRFFTAERMPRLTEIKVVVLKQQNGSRIPRGESSNNSSFDARDSRKTVMLLPLPMMGELFNLTPYPDDVWVQDLNRRLLTELSASNLRVLVKPHPEFDHSELGTMATSLGAEIVEGRFEDVANLANAFLFTHPLTSTLQYAMEHGLQSLVIDFGFVVWHPAMKRELSKRAKIIDGRIDENHSLQFDGTALRRALSSMRGSQAIRN